MQGRFQLVGDVGGKLPAVALGKGLLRHVEGQQDRTRRPAAGLNAADVQLVLPSAPLQTVLAVAAVQCAADGGADLGAALHRQEILIQAGAVRAEQLLGRRVDAQNRPLFVQKHQALLHAAGNLGKFVVFPPQLLQLAVNLPALAVDAVEQRRQLLIGVIFQRGLQIQRLQRRHDTAGNPAGQHIGQNQSRQKHQNDGLQHPHDQHAQSGAADGNAQDRAVREPACAVEGLFQQGLGIAGAFAAAALQSLPDLLPVGVVLHGLRVGAGVAEDPAVGVDPGQTIILRVQTLQIVAAAQLHSLRRKAQFIPELVLLHPLKIVVKAAQNDDQAGQQHCPRREHDGLKYLLCHFGTSHR